MTNLRELRPEPGLPRRKKHAVRPVGMAAQVTPKTGILALSHVRVAGILGCR